MENSLYFQKSFINILVLHYFPDYLSPPQVARGEKTNKLNMKIAAKEKSLFFFISEPREYICSFCKINTESAWSLVQHVQSVHGVQIYSENKLTRDTNSKGPRDLLREFSVPAMTISCSSQQQQQQNGAKKTGFAARQFESLGLAGNGGSKSDSLSFNRYS